VIFFVTLILIDRFIERYLRSHPARKNNNIHVLGATWLWQISRFFAHKQETVMNVVLSWAFVEGLLYRVAVKDRVQLLL